MRIRPRSPYEGYPFPPEGSPPRALIATQAINGRTSVTCHLLRVIDCRARYSGFRPKQALCNGTRMAIEK